MSVKKRICLYLVIVFLLNLANVQVIFSQENISVSQSESQTEAEDLENISTENPEISETEPAVELEATEAALETEAPTEELIADSSEGEEASMEDNQYKIIPLGDNKFLAAGIKTRDLEVMVTDGYNPIPNAEVTVCEQSIISDFDGKAFFADIPVSDEEYTVTVNCELGEHTESIRLSGTEILSAEDEEIAANKVTISYWLPESADGAEALTDTSESAVFSLQSETANMLSAYSAETYTASSETGTWSYNYDLGIAEINRVIENNGKIYVFGNLFAVYNPSTDSWTQLTYVDDIKDGEIALCNGKFYLYKATWRSAGDDAWAAIYDLKEYDATANTWTTVSSSTSGGIFDPAISVSGNKIYYGGGYEVVTDEPTEQYREELTSFDVVTKTWSSHESCLSGGYTTAVLCQDSGEYYNNIFYFSSGSYVYRFSITTGTMTSISSAYDYDYANQTATLINGKIYLLGGESIDKYCLQIYDIANNTWTKEDVPLYRAHTATDTYNGKIYSIGGDIIDNTLDVYDTATGVWDSVSAPDVGITKDCMVIYGGKLYAVSYDGTLVIYDLPSSVSNETISAGANHLISVIDGYVQVYGDNTYGQLGTGDNEAGDELTDITNTLGYKKVVKTEARGNTTFVLTEDNILYGWGENTNYQLGDGTNINRNTPVQIMTGVKDISVGYDHAVALMTNGDVYAWGDNSNGQLGVENISYSSVPFLLDISEMTDIAAGDSFSLSVDTNGDVWAWGDNSYCQLGISNVTTVDTPTETSISDISEICAGKTHSIAIGVDGSVYTWGNNESGQLGVVTTETYTAQAQELNLTNIKEVRTNANHSIAVTASGAVYTWGDNTYGQLGYSTETAYSYTPAVVNNINCTDVAAGEYSSFGQDEQGNIYRWGLMSNSPKAALSTGTTNIPIKIDANVKFVQVDASRHTAVALDSEGNVYTWGNGEYYDLGHGEDKTNEYYPKKVEGLPQIKQVAKGKHHTLALDVSGNVWGWGTNSSGQVASSLKGKVYVPTMISGLTDIKSISAGESFSAALKTDGTVWTWGGNGSGQLGTDVSGTALSQVSGLSDVSVIDCGDTFMTAISGTTLYTWGNNASGQLGDGTLTSRSTPMAVQGAYKDVSAGREFVLAISLDNKVYSWGRNSIGQLGLNDKDNRTTPTQITTLSDSISKVFASYSHSIAVSDSGELYAWGEGRSGQMGNGESATARIPKKVANMDNVKCIAGGNDFSVVLDKDGYMWAFGSNEFGGLGIKSNVPIIINDSDNSGDEIIDVEKDISNCYTTSEVIESKNSVNVYKFIPEESQTYIFTTVSDMDTYGMLYDSNNALLDSNDDGNGNLDFRIRYDLIAGNTYYLKVKGYNGDTGNFDLYIETPLTVTID